MSNRLGGKIALVTGGTSGIGLATARRFLDEGALVYITGRRQDALDAAVQELGKGAIGVQGDVSNLADLDRLYDRIAKEHGRLDVLFANAGVFSFSPIEAMTEEHFDREFGINVRGVFFSVQKALPLLSKGAAIVLNGSVVGSKGFESSSVYSATKAAVRSFARTWANELRTRGIRVNVVSPGPVVTPGAAVLGGGEEAFQASFGSLVPLGRVGRPEEIANAAFFLASEEASFITGAELFVDGGIGQV